MGGLLSDLAHLVQGIVAAGIALAVVAIALWWLWQGIQGTWALASYALQKHTRLVIVALVIFGWNVIPGLIGVLVCLGPITLGIARSVWEGSSGSG